MTVYPCWISRLLVGVGIYKLGQKYGSCDSHCDLLHHKAGEERVAGSFPRDAKSAGLFWDGACLQVADSMSSWMVENLFPTNILHLLDGSLIHVSTVEESLHRMDSLMARLSADVAFLYSGN
jgi:hypothetical protein